MLGGFEISKTCNSDILPPKRSILKIHPNHSIDWGLRIQMPQIIEDTSFKPPESLSYVLYNTMYLIALALSMVCVHAFPLNGH